MKLENTYKAELICSLSRAYDALDLAEDSILVASICKDAGFEGVEKMREQLLALMGLVREEG